MTLISLAKNPVPGGATSGLVTTSDGVKLRYAIWDPTRSPLRGTCVIVQGRSEFIEKYFETVADLRRRGYAVATFDVRGQGGSDRALPDPAKGHVRHFKDYDLDLETIMRDIVLPRLPAPYIGLGHSLGGHILLRAALHAGGPFERMVLTGAMIKISDSQFGLARSVARGVLEAMCLAGASTAFVPGGSAAPTVAGPFENNVLTADKERFLRARAVLEAAPQLAIGSPTAGWMRAALRAMAQLQLPDTPKAVAVPVLFVAAGDDKIVSTTAIEEFALRTKLGSRVLIATSRHEILQEADDTRSRFWAAFDAYLSETAVAA